YPRLLVTFGGADAFREAMEVDVEQYIGVKSYKAKGKRLTTFETERIEELEPLRFPTPEEETSDAEAAEENENLKTDSAVEGDEEGTPVQLSLFDE
ncbi:MAG: DNA gyrase/topoisomerase IV subunit A, partial [Alloprevotella sp.]|nr:DNA gyrase/topoisomerase IV subunit A [Bacteroidales bacterium]MDY5770209.1 DNA gyrase/topoisomerase IV subunit A [Alloprevotella sp.]